MISQNVIPDRRSLGGYSPYAFIERGAAVLSGVLRSKKAVQINISIMRAFVKVREYLSTHSKLLKKHDENIIVVFKGLKQMAENPKPKQGKKYGFKK